MPIDRNSYDRFQASEAVEPIDLPDVPMQERIDAAKRDIQEEIQVATCFLEEERRWHDNATGDTLGLQTAKAAVLADEQLISGLKLALRILEQHGL